VAQGWKAATTMDYRATLLAMGLALGCTGCITTGSQSGKEPSNKESALAKRMPKPATWVAWAACRERQAECEASNPRLRQEYYDQARQAYQQAIKADPTHLPAYSGLARTYMLQGQVSQALETYHQALEKKPDDPGLWLELAMCHSRAKQWELAIGSLQKALEFDKENRRILQTLGFCQARAGLASESVATLSRVMSAAEANYNVARMMQHLKREDLCRQYLDQALQLDPNLSQARSLLEALDRPAGDAGFTPAAALEINFEDTP
jgi:tetratricopeptide (TPR) repeat protein